MARQALTIATAVEVKRRLWVGENQADIANSLNLSQAAISDINRGKSWQHVPWPDGGFDPPSKVHQKARKAGFDPLVPTSPASLPGLPPTQAGEGYDLLTRAAAGGALEDAADRVESGAAIKERIVALVEATREEHDAALDAEIKDIVQKLNAVPTEHSEEAIATVPIETPSMEWDKVVGIAGRGNRFIAIAAQSDGFKRALCVVYAAIPPNDWNETFVYPLVLKTAELLGIEIKMEDDDA